MMVLEEMQLFSIGILFFHLIFDIVELIFIMISVLLIYSLLLIRLESKTLETGIMRMIGLSKSGIVLMIFLQCTMFVLPAIVLAFICCFPALAVCYSFVFNASTSLAFPPVPTGWAVIEAILVGLFIPFLSSIVPVMRVLNKNLNDALNYDRSRTKAIYVEILNNSKSDVLPMIAFGSLAVTYGISIFYLFPLSLISFNFALLL